MVERRADQVVHGSVDDDEALGLCQFLRNDAGHHHAGGTGDAATGLEYELGV